MLGKVPRGKVRENFKQGSSQSVKEWIMLYLRTLKVCMTKIFQQDFPLHVAIFKHTAVSNYLKLMYNAINVMHLKSQVTGQLSVYMKE